MQKRKILWGAIVFTGACAAIFLWSVVAPTATENAFDAVRGVAMQTWSELFYASGKSSDQGEIVIDDSSSSDDVENISSAQDVPPSSTIGNVESSKKEKTKSVSAMAAKGSNATNSPNPPDPADPVPNQSSLSSAPSPTATSQLSGDEGATIGLTASPSTTSSCSFSFPSVSGPSSILMLPLSRKVIFNEIAWMGSSGASTGEWMEIKNNSDSDVDLSGWEIVNATGKIKISFIDGDHIPADGFFLLARTSAVLGNNIAPQKTYSGDLRNAGDDLALIDAACNVSDFLEASSTGWPAGDNTTKQTMERDADGVGWHTSATPGGTPGEENSVPPAPASYAVKVAFEGSNNATVTSNPVGMVCATDCTGTYASGTKLTLTIIPGSSTIFDGWQGACYGKTACTLTLSGDVSIVAQLHSALALPLTTTAPSSDGDNNAPIIVPTVASSSDVSSTVATSSSLQPTTALSPSHIVIAAVQIAGAMAGDDFIKLYNPTPSSVDMSGWKLRKKSQSGADYSIREFPAGTTIAPQQYFVWANSADGFAASVNADASSTQTLAADNSVALMDASDAIVDAVAWGTGTGQYGEGPPYPTDPAANQMLVRQTANGVMVDTDNNASDFTLQ